jgi:phosphoribosylformylglycinamidine synthase II
VWSMSKTETPLYEQLGMTHEEYQRLLEILDREPSHAELAMYSVMWSEHCSYKSSKKHLGRFPTEAPFVVVGPGENAGVIDIGDGWLAAIRIESHNHPSYVEPFEGAATGVGGILRDVFTMGARPVGLWNQIRFGPLDDAYNRYLLSGVVSGIAGYGNAVGVPTLGGELAFEECYSGNPLVNVMCLGILKREQLVLGTAGTPGTMAVLLGNATGRDGIGGASVLASASFDEESTTKRPSVQAGDPFEEKKLIEACLELYQKDLVVGVQDLGAAGLSCAFSEPAGRAGVGLDVDLDSVHVREPDMTPAELLMSESQERMMAFVHPSKVDEVIAIAHKWEIDASVVGEVKEGGTLTIRHEGEIVAEVSAASLSDDAPLYDRTSGEPAWIEDIWTNTMSLLQPPNLSEALLMLLDDPSLADPRWVYQQYDHQLFLSTVVEPGHDASMLRIKGTQKGLSVSTDGNGRHCYLDPRRGGARLVYESALNVAMTGAKPMAVVDNLNFGNPEKSDVMWQFIETVEGISQACEELGTAVVGGNVSFYNETDGQDIYPTPIVGMLGLADPMPERPPRLDGAAEGMELLMVGPRRSRNLAGSAFEKVMYSHVGGRPDDPDPVMARAVIGMAIELASSGLAPAMHDISEGGAALCAAELAIASSVGLTLQFTKWEGLFAENPNRFLAAVAPQDVAAVEALAVKYRVPVSQLGLFGGDHITYTNGGPETASLSLERATHTYEKAIPRRME